MEREVSYAALTADEAEIFHLDYDEHLRPFVDFETDEATREIVESHLKNCSFCAAAVRELREFSDGLKMRGLRKNTLEASFPDRGSAHVPRRLLNGSFQYLVLPAALALILGIGGWLIWRQPETAILIAENQTPEATPEVTVKGNSFDRFAANTPVSPGITGNKLPSVSRSNNSANKNPREQRVKVSDSPPSEDARLLAALPAGFRLQFQNALRTQSIKLPEFIAALREKSNLRGGSENEKKIFLSPNAQAERNLRPTFRWRKFAGDGANYIVTIYDKDFNQIAVSPNLRGAKWQSNAMLERGEIYRWQITTDKSADSYSAQFKVLDESAISRLKAIEKSAPRSPLARGIGYAAEGLLTEAKQMFQKEITKNPRGKLAGKLKHSLTSDIGDFRPNPRKVSISP